MTLTIGSAAAPGVIVTPLTKVDPVTGVAGRPINGAELDHDFRQLVAAIGGTTDAINGINISSLGAAPASVGGDNLLINGDLSVNQRDFAGGALAPWTYGYDRWKAAGPGANISQVNGTITLASGWIYQVVEAPGLAGQKVTFSVEDPSANVIANIDGVQQVISAGAGRRGVTFTVTSGSDVAVNVLATNATFKRMKLERGAVATPWNPRPAQQELALCQRYYYRLKNEVNKAFCPMLMNGVGGLVGAIPMPVTMRANTIVSRSANAADFAIGYPGSDVATDVTVFGSGGWPHAAIIAATVPTRTTPGHLYGLSNAPCWIAFDAEF